jgi:hypothetical protein
MHHKLDVRKHRGARWCDQDFDAVDAPVAQTLCYTPDLDEFPQSHTLVFPITHRISKPQSDDTADAEDTLSAWSIINN